jgi:hypothetical protein
MRFIASRSAAPRRKRRGRVARTARWRRERREHAEHAVETADGEDFRDHRLQIRHGDLGAGRPQLLRGDHQIRKPALLM